MSLLDDLLTDLAAEGDRIDALVAPLDEEGWRRSVPAEGWDIATTIAHLLWTDEVAVLSATGDKERWDAVVLEAIGDPTGFVDTAALAIAGELSGAELLERWRASRRDLSAALREVPEGTKLWWFGPPMSASSMATARFMETWAHGLDVDDALGESTEPSDRIRHVAHLGVRTRNYAFSNNGLEAPAEEFRVELKAPSGETWSWGPEDAAQRVTGSAYDFCRLVTQRVNRLDTDLVAEGDDAGTWLDIAQAFAGPSGGGRAPQEEAK